MRLVDGDGDLTFPRFGGWVIMLSLENPPSGERVFDNENAYHLGEGDRVIAVRIRPYGN